MSKSQPSTGGPRPHRCDVCHRSFREVATLRKHEQLHRADRPYACTTCGKSFLWSSNLKVHERVHTGERPYKCKICQRSFTQSNDLRRHERNVHLRGKLYGYKSLGKNTIETTPASQGEAPQQKAGPQPAVTGKTRPMTDRLPTQLMLVTSGTEPVLTEVMCSQDTAGPVMLEQVTPPSTPSDSDISGCDNKTLKAPGAVVYSCGNPAEAGSPLTTGNSQTTGSTRSTEFQLSPPEPHYSALTKIEGIESRQEPVSCFPLVKIQMQDGPDHLMSVPEPGRSLISDRSSHLLDNYKRSELSRYSQELGSLQPQTRFKATTANVAPDARLVSVSFLQKDMMVSHEMGSLQDECTRRSCHILGDENVRKEFQSQEWGTGDHPSSHGCNSPAQFDTGRDHDHSSFSHPEAIMNNKDMICRSTDLAASELIYSDNGPAGSLLHDSAIDLSINKSNHSPHLKSPGSVSLAMYHSSSPASTGSASTHSAVSWEPGRRDAVSTPATSVTDVMGVHHCKHCNISFHDYTMFHLHDSLHLPHESHPFRCPSCGTHCQDKVEFMFHTVWHVKYPHTIPNYSPSRGDNVLLSS